MIRIVFTAAVLSMTGCAAFDVAHIEGQKADAKKYQHYSDVELAKQNSVSACFARATTDNQLAMCALYGQGVGITSTFAGRPTGTNIAPTTMQSIGSTLETIAPYGAAAAIARSVSKVQSKDPVVTVTKEPVVVEKPVIVTVPTGSAPLPNSCTGTMINPCNPNFKPFPWHELPSITLALEHVADSKTVYSLAEQGTEEVYWYAVEHGVTNQWLLELLQPSKTIWNKIGEFFAQGTSCNCCLGYRAIIGFVLGTGVGICLAYLIG